MMNEVQSMKTSIKLNIFIKRVAAWQAITYIFTFKDIYKCILQMLQSIMYRPSSHHTTLILKTWESDILKVC